MDHGQRLRARPLLDVNSAIELAWVRDVAASGEAREIRRRAGLSQREVALSIGATRSGVALWEEGRRAPQGAPALRYASLLKGLMKITGDGVPA